MRGLMEQMCFKTTKAEFPKTLMYYTNGCSKWNVYTMAVHSTRMVVPPSHQLKEGVNDEIHREQTCGLLNASDVYESLARDICENVR